jgi:cyclic pyranopterin phosphate synthase
MPREIYDDHEYLPRAQILTYDEIVAVASAAAEVGVRKVRLTGGEPLLRRELPTLVGTLASIEGIEDLALTTNGQFLASQASDLARAGLDRLTVSLDGLHDEVVRRMIDTDVAVSTVLEGLDAAERAGLGPVKVNTVVRRGWNEDQVLALVEHFRFTGHTVRFIEFMDVGSTNQWSLDDVVPSGDLVELIGSRWRIVPLAKSHRGEVADTYRFADGGGSIGFISSVTEPFCGSCSRLRLSAEGSLYTCLFATEGTDVKAMLRSGAGPSELASVINSLWRTRDDRYSELRGAVPLPEPRIEMGYIGG